ncbi:hypothetical protein E2C01_055823 [Portunus trituberculatus]|uniref:Uncharacterized protein n=1 Tax=Portunus trituberculatus TaxID=210409 RepID=A0A5B7GY00_PORTR|nr:hypothetical protein [Portunus trituberculatus]
MVSVGSGRRLRVDSNPTKYELEAMPFVDLRLHPHLNSSSYTLFHPYSTLQSPETRKMITYSFISLPKCALATRTDIQPAQLPYCLDLLTLRMAGPHEHPVRWTRCWEFRLRAEHSHIHS